MRPEVIFFGTAIPTYFVYLGLLFSALVFYVSYLAKKLALNRDIALNLGLIIMIAGFFGARAFHIFYEQPEIYLSNGWLFFSFWFGGFVWYGGAILAFVACAIYLKRISQPITVWLDFYTPIIALGYGLGRIGCFLAGCCHGKATDLPWGLHFPFDPGIARHPTQLYATFWELAIWVALTWIGRLTSIKRSPGNLFFIYGCLHAIGRLLMESFREDNRGPQIWILSISSWLSFALFSLCFFFC